MRIHSPGSQCAFIDSKNRMQGYDDTIGVRSYIFNDEYIGYVDMYNKIQYFI